MKVNDYICINSGLDIYETGYSAGAGVFSLGAHAQASRGIGQVLAFELDWINIKWLKMGAGSWWYNRKDIEQNFHVIKDSNLIKVLYG